VPGAQTLSFAQLQIWDEDNNPVPPDERARSSPRAKDRCAASGTAEATVERRRLE
jgi:hypothetical protein